MGQYWHCQCLESQKLSGKIHFNYRVILETDSERRILGEITSLITRFIICSMEATCATTGSVMAWGHPLQNKICCGNLRSKGLGV